MTLLLTELGGRILLKGSLGSGGMGEVHRAWDTALDRPVAVKLLRGSDPEEADRLLLEARLQARVEHPHVVRVLDTGSLEGRPCIVLQLVDGRSFADLQGHPDWKVKVLLAAQAARGLSAAHRMGLVHRDVKPSNILVEDGEAGPRALLSDFGLARDEEGGLTRSGLLMGTVDFMAPEQVTGEVPVDFHADIYGLGATLYAVLTGHPPFRDSPLRTGSPIASGAGQDDPTLKLDLHPGTLLRRVMEEEPRALSAEVAGLPGDLSVVVSKAMEKRPQDRYPTAEALADDLERVARGEPILMRRAPMAERLLRWAGRNKLAARALATAAAAVLVGVGLTFWMSRRASLEALEAAQFGAEAAAMREVVRAEHLAPAHDLRPFWATLKLRVQALERRPGIRNTGAGIFALGTGRELLGDHDGARAAFEEAWRRGFQTPEAALALGEALARQYEREVTLLGETVNLAIRKPRLAELAATYAEPARRMLAKGPRGGWLEPYSQGRIALLEGDHPAARRHAAAALAADPQRYEALALEGEAWVHEAYAAHNERKEAVALAALARARDPLVRATAWGRSDPGLYELLTFSFRIQATALQRLGRDPAPAIAEVERFAAVALALDPQAWSIHRYLGVALEQRGIYLSSVAPREALAPVEAAIRHFRRAAELAPAEIDPRVALAYAQYLLGSGQRELGRSGRAALEEGLRVAAGVHAMAPEELNVLVPEALLSQELGAALRDEGLDASKPLEAAISICERMLKIPGLTQPLTRSVLSSALADSGLEDWLDGRDFRPKLVRALEQAELARAEKPEAPSGAVDLAELALVAADMGLRIGDDVQPVLQRGLQALRALRAPERESGQVRVTRARLLAVMARSRFHAGADPLPLISEARGALLRESGFGSQPQVRSALARLDLLEADRRADQGQQAEGLLESADRRFRLLAREPSTRVLGLDGLAEVALRRALSMRAQGRPSPAAAARGLGFLRSAQALNNRDASRRLLEARLLALAGGEGDARQARAAAVAANPLLSGGADWRAALAEAAASRRTPRAPRPL